MKAFRSGLLLLITSVVLPATAGGQPAAPAEATAPAEPAGPTAGGQPAAPAEATAPAEPAKPNSGAISAAVGLEITSQYFVRGLAQETEGFIAQPTMEIGAALVENAGPLSALTLAAGSWSSFHTGPTGSGGEHSADPRAWFEGDLYADATLVFAEVISVGAAYTWYTSPNGSWPTIHEVAPHVGLDDGSFWPKSMFGGLQPAVTFVFEAEGQLDGGANEGIYTEIGLTPTFTFLETEPFTLGATLPLAVGISLHDFYEDAAGEDSTFGFFSSGLTLEAGLGFIPARFGAVAATGGIKVLMLGHMPKELNGNDGSALIGFGGLSLSY